MSELRKTGNRVREVWSRPPQYAEHQMTFWMEHPLVEAERLNRMVSGSLDFDCHQWFIECVRSLGMTVPVARCLSLGCGFGELERGYSQYRFAARHDGIDIAEGAIDAAREAAKNAGLSHIRYWTSDLNTVNLPEECYDVVLAHQAIHHIERLEHLAEQVRRTLRPGGLFMLNEYVGPNRLQLPVDQRAFASGLLSLLPERYVRTPEGALRRQIQVPTEDEVIAFDPSEAVRSEDIVSVLGEVLELVERRDFGGNILQMGLDKIIGNFRFGDSRDDAWLRWLFEAEDRLLAEGVPSDFAVLVYRRTG